MWATLTVAVFTTVAPTLVPNDARANFNALCNRIKDYQAGRLMLQVTTPDTFVRPFVRAAVQFNPIAALTAAPVIFGMDRPLMGEAVKIDGLALQFGFQNNVHVCMLAVRQNGLALQFVDNSLRRSRNDITLRAVRQNGLALQFARAPVRYVNEVVFAAVRQNGNALEHVSYHLDDNRYDLVMEAVKNKGGALRWADSSEKDDRDIVYAAVINDGSAIEYASPRLQADPEIRAAAAAQIRYDASAEGSGVLAF